MKSTKSFYILFLIMLVTACSPFGRLYKEQPRVTLALPAARKSPPKRPVVVKHDSVISTPSSNFVFVTSRPGVSMEWDSIHKENLTTMALDEIVISASTTRNTAERNGLIDVEFVVTVPRALQQDNWMVNVRPVLMRGDTPDSLKELRFTGQRFRELQERDYRRYDRFLEKIIPDSVNFYRTYVDYRSFERYLNEHGITGVCDVSLMAMPGLDFVRDDLFGALGETGELTVRVSMFPTLLEDRSRLAALQAAHTGPLLSARGFKQFFDGVSSQHTAWVHDPYTNARFEGDCGRPTVAAEVMEALMAPAAAEGSPVRIHAIGDEAIHRCLDIFEAHPVASPAHHTIEHLENFQPDDIARIARADVIASVQPRHITLDPGGPERDLGPERVPYMWPFRTLLDSGATLAFGTDSPVTDIDPIDAVYTAVTRRDADTHEPLGGWLPEERITLAEALRAYTAGSAAAAQRADELGQLAPGMFADIVVLDPNPFELAPDDLQQAKVQATYVAGKKVYER